MVTEKRPRVENEAAPGDTTDKSEDVDPEAKTPGDRCASPSATSSGRRNHVSSKHSPSSRDILRSCA